MYSVWFVISFPMYKELHALALTHGTSVVDDLVDEEFACIARCDLDGIKPRRRIILGFGKRFET
jgi:hypothetical protein